MNRTQSEGSRWCTLRDETNPPWNMPWNHRNKVVLLHNKRKAPTSLMLSCPNFSDFVSQLRGWSSAFWRRPEDQATKPQWQWAIEPGGKRLSFVCGISFHVQRNTVNLGSMSQHTGAGNLIFPCIFRPAWSRNLPGSLCVQRTWNLHWATFLIQKSNWCWIHNTVTSNV